MITENEVFKIGKLAKPHGIKGEISFLFDNDIFDRVNCPYLVCFLDGIFVPFFWEEYRFKGKETALMKFEDLDSEEEVRFLSGVEVFFPRAYFEDESENNNIDYSWDYFVDFTIEDVSYGNIGIIREVDKSTMNILFVVENNDGDELFIPATEDFIVSVDDKNKKLKTNLPEGLF